MRSEAYQAGVDRYLAIDYKSNQMSECPYPDEPKKAEWEEGWRWSQERYQTMKAFKKLK